MKKIFISVGDPSADRHAAQLMKEILFINPNIEFIGIGGQKMEECGLKSIANIKDIAVVGFWEVAKKYNFFKNLLEKSKKIISEQNVDLFLPIDYPGFNIRLANFAKSKNIPVCYYIAPQLWAWGKNRANKIQKCVDKLLVVFPFEQDFFGKYNIDTEFVGHPLLDYEEFNRPILNYEQRENLIAFLPGSRTQEIQKHLSFIDEMKTLVSKKLPDHKIAIAKSKNIDHRLYQSISKDVQLFDNSLDLLNIAKFGIIKTGTSNLESALLGLPFAMFYKISYISYMLAKKMINLQYISIVNIIKNDNLVPEFIQKDANPNNIINFASELINNRTHYDEMQNELLSIKQILGAKGAAYNTAKIVLSYL